MTKAPADLALIAIALAAGALLPMQALLNGRLGVTIGNPLWASVGQNVVGTLAMAAVLLAVRPVAPNAAAFAATPAWAWIGGAIGATYVLAVLVATPALGATRAMTAVIAGQLIASVALDQAGFLHARRPLNLETLAGLALLGAGAVLILRRS